MSIKIFEELKTVHCQTLLLCACPSHDFCLLGVPFNNLNSSVFSQNSFWHLHNVAQLLQVSKLQTEPAMSRFQQVALSKLFHDLL